jgi:hypothetical protein
VKPKSSAALLSGEQNASKCSFLARIRFTFLTKG